jgi:hypothetical protein
VVAVYAHRVVPGSKVPVLGPAVVHTVSGIAGALRLRLFDDAGLIKKAPELVGRN